MNLVAKLTEDDIKQTVLDYVANTNGIPGTVSTINNVHLSAREETVRPGDTRIVISATCEMLPSKETVKEKLVP